ncbi:MAG: AAA family ATPase [Spirochaetota bacterium]
MQSELLRNQSKNILEELKPCVQHYKKYYYDLGDHAAKFMTPQALLLSEVIRIASYLEANEGASEHTLDVCAQILNEIDRSGYTSAKVKTEIDRYIQNHPDGKSGLNIEKIELPLLAKVVKHYDMDFAKNKFDLVSNYLFQIINLLVKSDKKISIYEKSLLNRYQHIFHHPEQNLPSFTSSYAKKDYLNMNAIFQDFFGPSTKKPSAKIEDMLPEMGAPPKDPEPSSQSGDSKDTAKKDDKSLLKGSNIKETAVEEEIDLDTELEKLNKLIGLETVKSEISNLVNILKVEKLRKDKDLPVPERSLHMVFSGNPGTGKTTIARMVSRIFKALGILEKGHLVETDRSGLVAGFVGQTAMKTTEICEKARGGVLFIDEAYALADGGDNDFGKEAINTLLKFMEDNRENFITIVAGYTQNMRDFIDENPGLQSRFNHYIRFPDYEPEELLKIFSIFTKKSKLKVTEKAEEKLLAIFQSHYDKRDDKFGNGRFARNLFEKVYGNQANRLVTVTDIDEETLCTLTEDDIEDIIVGA